MILYQLFVNLNLYSICSKCVFTGCALYENNCFRNKSKLNNVSIRLYQEYYNIVRVKTMDEYIAVDGTSQLI